VSSSPSIISGLPLLEPELELPELDVEVDAVDVPPEVEPVPEEDPVWLLVSLPEELAEPLEVAALEVALPDPLEPLEVPEPLELEEVPPLVPSLTSPEGPQATRPAVINVATTEAAVFTGCPLDGRASKGWPALASAVNPADETPANDLDSLRSNPLVSRVFLFRRSPMSRLLAAALVAACLALSPASARAADVKLGFVDLHRAVSEVADGRAAKAKLKKEYDTRQKELDEKQEEIKELQENLKSRGDAMSEDARRKSQEDLDQKVIEVGRLYQKLQKELGEKEQLALKGIFGKMNNIIQAIAEAENLTMVFEKSDSTLLYAQPSLDLTNELIRRYNSAAAKSAAAAHEENN
jgi:outer membrane protein